MGRDNFFLNLCKNSNCRHIAAPSGNLRGKLPPTPRNCRNQRQSSGKSGNFAARLAAPDVVDIYIAWRYNGFMYIDLRYIPCLFRSGARTPDSST